MLKLLDMRRLVLAVGCACAAAGCGPNYSHDGARAPGAAIPPRTSWQAYGDLRNPRNAIDGDGATSAVSEPSYAGASITIDLGKAAVFNLVILDHAGDEMGFARRVAVLTSGDGVNFVQRYAGPGKRRYTHLSLMTPTMARYVRIQAVVPGERPWSISEVYFQ